MTASPPRSPPTRAATTAAATSCGSRTRPRTPGSTSTRRRWRSVRLKTGRHPRNTDACIRLYGRTCPLPSRVRGRRRSTTRRCTGAGRARTPSLRPRARKSWAKESDDAEPDPRASAAAKAPAAPTKKPSKLASVARGKSSPVRPGACSTAPRASAKSSLAVDAGAIFLNIEDGLSGADAVRYIVPRGRRARRRREHAGGGLRGDRRPGRERPRLRRGSRSIRSMPFESRLLWPKVCKDHDEPTIESFGYGKGYTVALAEWRAC